MKISIPLLIETLRVEKERIRIHFHSSSCVLISIIRINHLRSRRTNGVAFQVKTID